MNTITRRQFMKMGLLSGAALGIMFPINGFTQTTRIKQNLFWAFAYNTALIPVAAGVLYPFFMKDTKR